MSHSRHCSSCHRDVGPTIKRGHFVFFAMLAIISFTALMLAQLAMLPSPSEQFLASKYGMPIETNAVSPFWFVLPLLFLLLAIRSFFNKQLICPLCRLPLRNE